MPDDNEAKYFWIGFWTCFAFLSLVFVPRIGDALTLALIAICMIGFNIRFKP